VSKPLIAILAALAVLTVWGAISPRGQWRVLAGWTRRDPYAGEPGPVSLGVHRFVAILATTALVIGGVSLLGQYRKSLPQPAPPLTSLEVMWGATNPVVVNRVIDTVPALPSNLVPQPILRYQRVDGARRAPNYLFALQDWKLVGALGNGGLAGVQPGPGLTALDTAAIVVQVRGDKNCIPRAIYATEGPKTVVIAVYYGRPDAGPGATAAALASCTPKPPAADSVSVLIPIRLQTAVEKRVVQNLDGTPISMAPSRLH